MIGHFEKHNLNLQFNLKKFIWSWTKTWCTNWKNAKNTANKIYQFKALTTL